MGNQFKRGTLLPSEPCFPTLDSVVMGCCERFCGGMAGCLLKVTAAIIFVTGLGVLAFGLYLMIKQTGGVAVFVLSVGGYALLCGLLGLCLSCKRAPFCTTRIYVLLLTIGALIQGAVAVAIKVDKTWTEKFFSQHACTSDTGSCDGTTDQWIDHHIEKIFWVLLISASAEFLASFLACCYSSTHHEEAECYDEEEAGYGANRYAEFSRTSNVSGTGVECRQPLTDGSGNPASQKSYVDSLREKYNIPAKNGI